MGETFACGCPRAPENASAYVAGNGKLYERCRRCKQEQDRQRYQERILKFPPPRRKCLLDKAWR